MSAAAAPAAAPPKRRRRKAAPTDVPDDAVKLTVPLEPPAFEAVLHDTARDLIEGSTSLALHTQSRAALRLLYTGEASKPSDALVEFANSVQSAFWDAWEAVKPGSGASEQLGLALLKLYQSPDAGLTDATAENWYGAGALVQAWAQLVWVACGGEGEYADGRAENEATLRNDSDVFTVASAGLYFTTGPGARLPVGFRVPLANVFGHAMFAFHNQWMAAADAALKGGSAEEILRELVLPKDDAEVARILAAGMVGSESNQHLYYTNTALVKVVGDELAKRVDAHMKISSHGLAAEEREAAAHAANAAAAAQGAAGAAPAAGAGVDIDVAAAAAAGNRSPGPGPAAER